MKVTNNLVYQLTQNKTKVEKDIEKIADPKKVEEFANALLEDSLQINADTAMQEISNFNNAIGFAQIADSALQGISDNVSQIKELQVRSNNAALNSDNLAAINDQISKLSENINKTLENTTFNGKNVFGEFNFNEVKLNTSMPEFSVDNLDEFEKALKQAQSSVGAFQNSLNDKIDNLNTFVVNTLNAKDNQDIAKDVMDLNNDKVKLTASTLAAAHQNILYSKVADLLS